MYLWLKALHIIAVITWMAGLLALPWLFAHHASAAAGSPMSDVFKVMERRLLKAIVNPSLVVVLATGSALGSLGGFWEDPWLQIKLAAALGLVMIHGYLARRVKVFARDGEAHSAGFFRVLGGVPAVLMILIVLLVVLKPF